MFDTVCGEVVLDRNWQRLVLTHLQEKQHLGVLTGSQIADLRIPRWPPGARPSEAHGGRRLPAGDLPRRAAGPDEGDILLGPYYAFRLTVPPEQIGRAISDIRAKRQL